MLMCEETVTLVHEERTDDGESYVCTVIQGASWYGKAAMAQTTEGITPQNTYKSRFPATVLVQPHKGDFLVRGVVEIVKRAPADLKGREYFCITAVGDNRRGRLQHWTVSGA